MSKYGSFRHGHYGQTLLPYAFELELFFKQAASIFTGRNTLKSPLQEVAPKDAIFYNDDTAMVHYQNIVQLIAVPKFKKDGYDLYGVSRTDHSTGFVVGGSYSDTDLVPIGSASLKEVQDAIANFIKPIKAQRTSPVSMGYDLKGLLPA